MRLDSHRVCVLPLLIILQRWRGAKMTFCGYPKPQKLTVTSTVVLFGNIFADMGHRFG